MPDNLLVDISPDSNLAAYEIIHMEGFAEYIEFTTTEDMGASTTDQASISQTDFWGPPHLALDPSATVVHDNQSLFGHCLSGDKGLAVYDPIENIYVIVRCGPEHFAAWGSLHLTTTGWTYTVTGYKTIDWDTDLLSRRATNDQTTNDTITVDRDGVYALNVSFAVGLSSPAFTGTKFKYNVQYQVNGAGGAVLSGNEQIADPHEAQPSDHVRWACPGVPIDLNAGDAVRIQFEGISHSFFIDGGYFSLI